MSRRSKLGLRVPSPAMVVAAVALFVTLGGASWAAGLSNNEVKTRNIAKKAVTAGKLATGAAKTAKIRDGAVTAIKLAAGAVGTDALADSAVTKKKIKAQAVTSPKLGDGAVSAAKLADGSVENAKLAAGAVDGEKLAAGAVTSEAVLTAFTDAVDFGDLMPGECERAAVAADAVKPGDSVVLTRTDPTLTTVLADADATTGEIGVRGCNVGTAALDPPSANYRFLVIR